MIHIWSSLKYNIAKNRNEHLDSERSQVLGKKMYLLGGILNHFSRLVKNYKFLGAKLVLDC